MTLLVAPHLSPLLPNLPLLGARAAQHILEGVSVSRELLVGSMLLAEQLILVEVLLPGVLLHVELLCAALVWLRDQVFGVLLDVLPRCRRGCLVLQWLLLAWADASGRQRSRHHWHQVLLLQHGVLLSQPQSALMGGGHTAPLGVVAAAGAFVMARRAVTGRRFGRSCILSAGRGEQRRHKQQGQYVLHGAAL